MFDKIAGSLSGILVFVASVAVVLMMLHISADIAGKTIFNTPVEGTIEIVESYYMVAVVVLPFAYIARGEGHIIVELFTRGLSPRHLAALEILVGIVTFLFMLLMAWNSGDDAISKTIMGEVRESGDDIIVTWPTRWLIPLGAGVMAIAVLVRLGQDIKAFLGKADVK